MSPGTSRQKRIFLDLRALDRREDHLLWMALVDGLASYCREPVQLNVVGTEEPSVRVPASVEFRSLSDFEFPSSGSFTYLSGSEVLGRKLLAWSENLIIRPSGLPLRVDTHFYWREIATGKFQQLLDELGVHQGFPANMRPAERRASLLTSIYKGDEFLEGFLQNCRGLHGYSDAEHFLVRAASPGNEHDALIRHVDENASAVYINLDVDPGLYEVWNLCARLSSAPYLSNANLDDRRSPLHLRELCRALDRQPDVAVASSAMRVTSKRNLDWTSSQKCKQMFAGRNAPKGVYDWRSLVQEKDGRLRARDLPHCMPVWRKGLHGEHGWFDESAAGPSADWEFWLRAGRAGKRFYLSAQVLGLYLKVQDSYWHTARQGRDFDAEIIERYVTDEVVELAPTRDQIQQELENLDSCDAQWLALQRLRSVNGRYGESVDELVRDKLQEALGLKNASLRFGEDDALALLESIPVHVLRNKCIAGRWGRLFADIAECGSEGTAIKGILKLLECEGLEDEAAALLETVLRRLPVSASLADAFPELKELPMRIEDEESRYQEARFIAARDMWQHFENLANSSQERLAQAAAQKRKLEARVRRLEKDLQQAGKRYEKERQHALKLSEHAEVVRQKYLRLVRSRSWRLTAPMRALINLVRVYLLRRKPIDYSLPSLPGRKTP